jgi:hypothetical protein
MQHLRIGVLCLMPAWCTAVQYPKYDFRNLKWTVPLPPQVLGLRQI